MLCFRRFRLVECNGFRFPLIRLCKIILKLHRPRKLDGNDAPEHWTNSSRKLSCVLASDKNARDTAMQLRDRMKLETTFRLLHFLVGHVEIRF